MAARIKRELWGKCLDLVSDLAAIETGDRHFTELKSDKVDSVFF